MTLTEALGVVGNALFVPSDVIDSQQENQEMLAARAESINADPHILTVTQADPKMGLALQSMNRDIYLSSKHDQESGQAILDGLYDSIQDIPKNLKSAITESGSAVGEGIANAVPWWLRILLGIALVAVILYFLRPLIARAAPSAA